MKRAVYQAGHIWGQSLIGEPEVASPDSWGWKRVTDDATWTPCWTTLPEAAMSCQELMKCGMQTWNAHSCASAQDSAAETESITQ